MVREIIIERKIFGRIGQIRQIGQVGQIGRGRKITKYELQITKKRRLDSCFRRNDFWAMEWKKKRVGQIGQIRQIGHIGRGKGGGRFSDGSDKSDKSDGGGKEERKMESKELNWGEGSGRMGGWDRKIQLDGKD